MPEATRKMLLYCDVTSGRYTLTAEGEDWQQTFHSFEEAYEEAEARTAETIPFLLCSASGEGIMESTVSPAPLELVQFNHPLMGRRRIYEHSAHFSS
ncbi:MAG: hypothetical protein P4L99_14545 [Chthoniobacter sp.]|nr:hypothetical protein [Chthoniobacter sp.]